MIAVVSPMPIELAGIRRRLRSSGQQQIALRITGVGRQATRTNWAQIVSGNPDAIILAGFCGGADPDLQPGDLHVADSYLNPEHNDSIAADQSLTRRLMASAKHCGIRTASGPSATVAKIAGVAVKRQLRKHTGAATVNMEDYWAARASRSAGIPFASVRAVTDGAFTELPDFIVDGNPGISKIAMRLAARPGSVRDVIHLYRISRVAGDNLSACAVGAIESMPQIQPQRAVVQR